MADFETVNGDDFSRVWGWGMCNIDDPGYMVVNHNIEQFMDSIADFSSIIYFHNLKFDGMFVIDWLLNNGFKHVSDERNPRELYFTTLISDMGQFYTIKVNWGGGNLTEFRDSLKKLPMTVDRIAKAFNLEIGKGEIDYNKDRPIGYEMTEDEYEYICHDVMIVAEAIYQVIESGMKKLTVASDSLAEFKKLTGAKNFSKLFPVLSIEMDAEIRRAYRGGFTYADPRFKGKKHKRRGVVIDVNSLYPSVMYNELMPYGEPEHVPGRVLPTERRPLTIFSVTFTAKLKKNHIPCIQIKGSSRFSETEYLTEISEPTTLSVTNVDWDLYNDHYDVNVVEYNGGWRFKATRGLFDSYIEKWSKIKETTTGGEKEIAKLHLNSLYGRFATNPNVTSKYPILKDGRVKLVRGVDEVRDPVYTAVGVFITSFARDLTVRAAQASYPTFAYADTDSLHLMSEEIPEGVEIHPTKMGAWKVEYYFDEALYIRPKAYLELSYGTVPYSSTYTNRIAGLPTRISEKLTIDEISDGMVISGKLAPRTVPGGVILIDVPYELKM